MSGAAFVSGLSNHNKNGESLSYLQIDSSVNVSSTRRSVPKSFGDPGVGISQVEVYRRVGKSVI